MVLERDGPWTGPPPVLFDGTVHHTAAGALFVPVRGRLPSRSTGFWLPDADLIRSPAAEKPRFTCAGGKSFARFTWVGDAEAPDRIAAGSLVRVSLSRRFGKENVPEGYYVQISGVLRQTP